MSEERLQQETPGEPLVSPWPEREEKTPSPGEPIVTPWPESEPAEPGGGDEGSGDEDA